MLTSLVSLTFIYFILNTKNDGSTARSRESMSLLKHSESNGLSGSPKESASGFSQGLTKINTTDCSDLRTCETTGSPDTTQSCQSTTPLTLLTKTQRQLCQATAWAMACRVSLDKFLTILGHDGSEIVRDAPEPLCRLGHHSQECVAAAFQLGVRPVQFNTSIGMGVPGYPPVRISMLAGEEVVDLILRLLCTHCGVVNVACEGSGRHHSMAFDHGLFLDPDGRTWDLDAFTQDFVITTLWVTE